MAINKYQDCFLNVRTEAQTHFLVFLLLLERA